MQRRVKHKYSTVYSTYLALMLSNALCFHTLQVFVVVLSSSFLSEV